MRGRCRVRGEGKSLLPIGMTAVDGDFSRGDVGLLRDPGQRGSPRAGQLFQCRGAPVASRKPSSEFERLLRYVAEAEMVHHDNLVLTTGR